MRASSWIDGRRPPCNKDADSAWRVGQNGAQPWIEYCWSATFQCHQVNALAAAIAKAIGNHSMRGTGITTYL